MPTKVTGLGEALPGPRSDGPHIRALLVLRRTGQLAAFDLRAHRDAVLDQDLRHLRKAAAAAAALTQLMVNEIRRQHRIRVIAEQPLDDALDVAARDDVARADDHEGGADDLILVV